MPRPLDDDAPDIKGCSVLVTLAFLGLAGCAADSPTGSSGWTFQSGGTGSVDGPDEPAPSSDAAADAGESTAKDAEPTGDACLGVERPSDPSAFEMVPDGGSPPFDVRSAWSPFMGPVVDGDFIYTVQRFPGEARSESRWEVVRIDPDTDETKRLTSNRAQDLLYDVEEGNAIVLRGSLGPDDVLRWRALRVRADGASERLPELYPDSSGGSRNLRAHGLLDVAGARLLVEGPNQRKPGRPLLKHVKYYDGADWHEVEVDRPNQVAGIHDPQLTAEGFAFKIGEEDAEENVVFYEWRPNSGFRELARVDGRAWTGSWAVGSGQLYVSTNTGVFHERHREDADLHRIYATPDDERECRDFLVAEKRAAFRCLRDGRVTQRDVSLHYYDGDSTREKAFEGSNAPPVWSTLQFDADERLVWQAALDPDQPPEEGGTGWYLKPYEIRYLDLETWSIGTAGRLHRPMLRCRPPCRPGSTSGGFGRHSVGDDRVAWNLAIPDGEEPSFSRLTGAYVTFSRRCPSTASSDRETN